jgi:hypothetical protein
MRSRLIFWRRRRGYGGPFDTIRKWEYFDSDIGKDSAREIREFHIPDFSNWTNPAAYRKTFDRLLDDLHGKTGLPSI